MDTFTPTPQDPTRNDRLAAKTAALVAVPVVAAGALLFGGIWLLRRRSAKKPLPQTQWMRKLVTNLDLDTARHEVLGFVRDTLVGLDRGEVRRLLGPPAAAAEQGVIAAGPTPTHQDVAGQWYYRLEQVDPDRQDGASLVVDFGDDDTADDARFLLPPRS